MPYAVYRLNPNGSETFIGYADGPKKTGLLIDDDRARFCDDVGYHCLIDEGEKHDRLEKDALSDQPSSDGEVQG